ncbi:MAG: sulfatase [Ignavibacteria bacterium]|nr:sulfatase [Ignavibacteria bacterium]
MSLIQKLRQFRYFKWILRLIIVVIVVAAVWGIVEYKNKPLCPNCNVILVSLDTLSALHLPCYGYERNTAPNLCKFAKDNIMFLNSYSQSPITLDSHFSIFTSLYPHTHKMTEILKDPLSEKYITLPQIFRANGYQTIYNGFINDDHLPLNRGIERGFNVIQKGTINSWDDAFTQFIKNNKENKPTFLLLHTYAVHEPYLLGHQLKHLFTDLPEDPNVPLTDAEFQQVSPEFFSHVIKSILNENFLKTDLDKETAKRLKAAKSIEEQERIFNSFSYRIRYICFITWQLANLSQTNKNQAEYIKALYDESIHDMDQKLSKLFELVSNPKLSKNTILIITADHGQEFMEHGHYYHSNNLFQASTRVPLIIHIPGVKPKKI